jgi:capsid portal protein
MDSIEGENGQHSFLVLETDTNETTAGFTEQKQPEVEIKDIASILQKDELFQEYQENGRKKVQSAFLLPDLYVGYTTDFNRATAQTAMEVTEKQVFQPERESLEWIVNNRLLNAYNFCHVQASFNKPDITNPDDIQKILNVTERAGGLTPNMAKSYTYEVLGKDGCEDYPGDWGDTPLAYSKTVSQSQLQQDLTGQALGNTQTAVNNPTGQNTLPQSAKQTVTDGEMQQLDEQILKAAENDEALVPIMKEIRKALNGYREKAGE